MCPNFFALFNKAGIACAADADHTIFRLSMKLPVAVAINPASRIPWERILHNYQQAGLTQERLTLAEYAEDFNAFLATVLVKNGWEKLPSDEMHLIFLGFGSQDIFPSVYDVSAKVKDGVLCLGDGRTSFIGENRDVFFNYLGNFDSVSTMIYGASPQVQSFFYEKNLELFRIYADRVRERFKGTEYESFVNRHLASYDADKEIYSFLNRETDNMFSAFQMGVDSFSIEDMVTAVETLVQSNAELVNLRAGKPGATAEVKEIAVLTIPEGLTWIKHSLYFRRNEI